MNLRTLFIQLTIFIFLSSSLPAQGIDFFHGSWAEALEKAKKEQKLIFVDAYAVWCGPCKRMAAESFTKVEVGEYYNANLINMKIDAESAEGIEFQHKYKVSSFPTLFFINGMGDVQLKVIGYQSGEQLIKIAQNAIGKQDNSGEFADLYAKGDRSPALILNYITALNKAGKPTLKIVNDYLFQKPDLDKEENLRILLEGCTEADSRIFQLVIDRKEKIAQVVGGADVVQKKLQEACMKSVAKAVQFNNADLFKEAKNKLQTHVTLQREEKLIEADLMYYRASGDVDKYLNAVSQKAKLICKKDAGCYTQLANEIKRSFPDHAGGLQKREELLKEAMDLDETPQRILEVAATLKASKKHKEAMKYAKKALDKSKEGTRESMDAQTLIDELNNI